MHFAKQTKNKSFQIFLLQPNEKRVVKNYKYEDLWYVLKNTKEKNIEIHSKTLKHEQHSGQTRKIHCCFSKIAFPKSI